MLLYCYIYLGGRPSEQAVVAHTCDAYHLAAYLRASFAGRAVHLRVPCDSLCAEQMCQGFQRLTTHYSFFTAMQQIR